MIEITQSARDKIVTILKDENNPNICLRIFVRGGGCSGLTYDFEFDEIKNEDDFEISLESYQILVDAISMQYLTGATLDYKEELMGSSFMIKNPNSKGQCGCGSSFAV